MKSERRHELQQNELAKDLEHVVVGIRPHINTILAAIAIVVVGSLVWAYMSGTRQAEREQAWSQFSDALSANDDEQLDMLLQVAKQNEGTTPAYWALQTAADVEANRGAALVFSNKKEAEEHLLAARNNYQKVTKAPASDALLSQRAWLGYAKAEESLYGLTGDGSHLDAAKEAYSKIKETWPDKSVAKVAAQRLDFLAMNDAGKFYDWLAEYKPTLPPLNPNGTNGFDPLGTGGANGRGGLELPEDLSFPGLGLEGADPERGSGFVPSETEVPATGAPAVDPPASETPAEPGTETPAAEPPAEPAADVSAPEPSADEPAADSTPPAADAPAADVPAPPAEPEANE